MRVKPVFQHDICDCGAACVAMIAGYYKYNASLQFFREIINTSSNGTSIYGIVNGCKKIGLCAEALKGSGAELEESVDKGEIVFPFIAHMCNNHYVVVSERKKDSFIIFDPEFGKIKTRIADFIKDWTGYIINFVPDKSFHPKKNDKSLLHQVAGLILPQWKKLITIFIMSVVVYGVGVFSSFVFQTVLDECYEISDKDEHNHEHNHEHADIQNEEHAEEHNDEQIQTNIIETAVKYIYEKSGSINSFFLILIMMYIISCFITYIRGKLVINLSRKIDISTTLVYYSKIIGISLKDKILRNNGDYLSRFSDSYRIRYAISNISISLVSDVMLSIVGAVILCEINARLFLISFTMIGLYCLVILMYKNKLDLSNKRTLQSNAKIQAYLKETLEGFENIKENAFENEVLNVGKIKYNEMVSRYYENDTIGLREGTLLDFIEMIGNVFVLWVGFVFVDKGIISIGTLITFTMLLAYFTEPVKNVVFLQPSMQSAANALDRIFDILNTPSEDMYQGERTFVNGDIVFDNVTFGYDDSRSIFNSFSLKLPKEKISGLTGKSGAGKSTLMKLLLRLYKLEDGNISVGGISVNDIPLNELRKKICYVGQESFMFENSLLYNLTWDSNRKFDEDIAYAANLCCVDEFVSKMPLGFDTYIAENGSSLSQGQKQRIAIARAIISKPDILVLDEAFSNIDLKTMDIILNNMKRELKDITIIIISHSDNVLSHCENVVVL